MRSEARECVYKYLFSKLFNCDDEGLFALLLQDLKNNDDKNFATNLLNCVLNNEKKYVDCIEKLSINFNINRVLNTDRCAILIGMAELENFKETPIAVSINEAVNLSSKYSSEKSPNFVNGILASFSKEM